MHTHTHTCSLLLLDNYDDPYRIVNCIESIINSTTTLNASNFVHYFISRASCGSQKGPRHWLCAAIKSSWNCKHVVKCNISYNFLSLDSTFAFPGPWPFTIVTWHVPLRFIFIKVAFFIVSCPTLTRYLPLTKFLTLDVAKWPGRCAPVVDFCFAVCPENFE